MPSPRNSFDTRRMLEGLLLLSVVAFLVAVAGPMDIRAEVDPREKQLQAWGRLLQSALVDYHRDHGAWPTGDPGMQQLTLPTNHAGEPMPRLGDPRDYPFGPYLRRIPPNPFVHPAVAEKVEIGTDSPGEGNFGWHYNPETGELRADHTGK